MATAKETAARAQGRGGPKKMTPAEVATVSSDTQRRELQDNILNTVVNTIRNGNARARAELATVLKANLTRSEKPSDMMSPQTEAARQQHVKFLEMMIGLVDKKSTSVEPGFLENMKA